MQHIMSKILLTPWVLVSRVTIRTPRGRAQWFTRDAEPRKNGSQTQKPNSTNHGNKNHYYPCASRGTAIRTNNTVGLTRKTPHDYTPYQGLGIRNMSVGTTYAMVQDNTREEPGVRSFSATDSARDAGSTSGIREVGLPSPLTSALCFLSVKGHPGILLDALQRCSVPVVVYCVISPPSVMSWPKHLNGVFSSPAASMPSGRGVGVNGSSL